MLYAARSAPPPGGDAMEFVLSDDSVDRVGDVIEQNWDLAPFRDNPIALFNHDRNQVIGRWEKVRVESGRLLGRLALAAEGTSALVDTVRKLLEQKILRAVSVGFQPIAKEKLNPDASEFWGPFRFLKSELLEASLVAVPANPNAVALARSMQVPPDLFRTLFSKPANEPRAAQPARQPIAKTLRGKMDMSTTQQQPQQQQTMTLAARIRSAQTHLVALRDRLADLDGREDALGDEEASRLVDLPDEIKVAEARLEQLTEREKAMGQRLRVEFPAPTHAVQTAGTTVVEVTRAPRAEPERRAFASPAAARSRVEDGDYVFRSLVTMFRSHCLREPLDHVLRDYYGDRDENMNAVLRAAVNPSMTTVAGNAAELVQVQNAGFLNRILPKSIYAPLAARGSRYTFGPGVSQIKIPVRTNSNLVAGAWVGEGAPKPVKRPSFAPVTLIPHKLAVISTFTEEMALYSNPAIEGIIRQALVDDTSVSLDSFLIDSSVATAARPAGLLWNITNLTPASTGTATEKMVADLKALISAIVTAGGGTDIVVLINPAQAMTLGFAQTSTGDFLFATVAEAGQKFNVGFIVSQTVQAGWVIAVDASEFATATGDTPRLAVSNEATLHEEDTTPLPIGTPGAPATVAAPVRSLFQTDSIAIRLTLYVTWQMRRVGMVQYMNTVGW